MVGGDLPALWADAVSPPLIAAGALAVTGWLMGAAGWGGRALWGVLVLVVLGAGAGLIVYVVNGVTVANALRADPLGGAVWFGLVGLQLAALGIVLFGLRLAMAGKEGR